MESEFHKNLPKKECIECGCEIREQYESYLHLCERCINNMEE
ncbi:MULTISPECIES: protein YhfH [Aneurinibacillus]|uniref:YhfH family protein n=1 Tax=Aneurinibacillus thermoaerophilus TaxID=143495 RepID=A0A1G7YEH3_ANETH|nr:MULTISPECIES: protein YhfH [Aneurinibacillus]MED0676514.1 protein YhfH [Aneurinibacillus thermoaerophilus]MED0679025.1 protein YhfH [Aneurinibacillus thermoaerophilus]MED0736564.1 protein YhfH [Aneurinibacillus thermoaerophilus]MED0756066.1 protein YhfH [Aneurinibacillus thermoaerophilus]MED0759610.1 protein YhfH [Aneurinibacillus thermoaerophilus]